LAAGLTMTIYFFRQPELALLFVLLPLLSMVTMRWSIAVGMEALVIGLLWWLWTTPAAPGLGERYPVTVLLASMISLMLGIILMRALFHLTEWYIYSFSQALQKVQEARRHRAQVLQLFKELDQAYYRLDRANAALVAARKSAEEAERFKTEFVTNVSHELRTPLNLIVGFSEMMITSPESYGGVQLPGAYRSDINAVNHSAQHLLALVDDVLDLARIEVGRLALAREPVEIASFIEETVEIVRDYIAAKGLALHIDVEQNLPTLWVDRLRIRQVLLNLLVNAARHTSRGQIAIQVVRWGEEMIIRVVDTGRGISKQDLGKVFEEFRSTEQPFSEWHSGTGLGLPISKKFVELHHGRMGVESTYGAGTTFWFTLPCTPGQGAQEQIAGHQRFQPVVRLGASERILVVVHEDEQVPLLLKRYLDGYQVIGVKCLEEGIRLAEEIKALALVVTDCVQEIVLRPEVLTIRLPLPTVHSVAALRGVSGLLGKPVARHELLAALERRPTAPARVLVVDDEPDMVRLFQRMLRPQPGVQEILGAYNGDEAMRLMRVKKPDLVLLDLMMPEVDGETLLAQMRSDAELAAVPVILVSAKAQDTQRLRVSGTVEFARAEGFELGEIVRAMEAALNALTPGWESLATTEPAREAAPAG
jgi:signal transduction histidine kinase/CheY-like chemotaxis protein